MPPMSACLISRRSADEGSSSTRRSRQGISLGARDRGISLEGRGRGALVVHMHEGHDTAVFVVCGGSIANLVVDKFRSRGDK